MADDNPFTSDLSTVPGVNYGGQSGIVSDAKIDGPSTPYPNANDGYGPGDAMTDAVEGIQHSGDSPSGGNTPQTEGITGAPTHAAPHVVGNPSAKGSTERQTGGNTVADGPISSGDTADPASHSTGFFNRSSDH